jgi:tetratricopeptide (TPR) repeat protein
MLKNNDMAKFYYYQTVHQDPLLDKGWLAITDFFYDRKKYEKAFFYINKALNIDGENAVYWSKCAKINRALQKYDQADYAFKQAVDLGNYELNTWLKWAEVSQLNKDEASAVQILKQGKEFHPESAKLLYKLAGFQLLTNDTINARITLIDALNLDIEKLFFFEEEFPQFADTSWTLDIIANIKKASR